MSCREAEFGSILVDLTGTAEQECDLNQEFIENQSLVGGECDVIFSKQQQISDLNDLNDVQMIAPAATEKVVSATTKTTLLDENPDLDCELAAQSLNNKIDLELDITSDTEEPMSSLNTVVDLHEQSSECAGQCELRDLDSTQLKQQPQSAEHGRAHSDFCLQSLSIEESSSNAICVANKNTITAESTTTTTTPEILFASADSISRFKDTQNGNVVPASQLDLLATSLLNDELGDLATNEGLNGNKLNGNNNNDDDVQRNFQGCSREANSGSTNATTTIVTHQRSKLESRRRASLQTIKNIEASKISQKRHSLCLDFSSNQIIQIANSLDKKKTNLEKTTTLNNPNNRSINYEQYHSIPSSLNKTELANSDSNSDSSRNSTAKRYSFSTFLGKQNFSSPSTPTQTTTTTTTSTSATYVTAKQHSNANCELSSKLNCSSNTLSNSHSFYASARSDPISADSDSELGQTQAESFHSLHSPNEQFADPLRNNNNNNNNINNSATSSTLTLAPDQQQQQQQQIGSIITMPNEEPEYCQMEVVDMDLHADMDNSQASSTNNSINNDNIDDIEPSQLIGNLALEPKLCTNDQKNSNNNNNNNILHGQMDGQLMSHDEANSMSHHLNDDDDDFGGQESGAKKQLASSFGRLAERRSSEGCTSIPPNITSIIQSATTTGSSMTPSQIRTLMRKNSIQMIESEKLPSVTEGVAMGRPNERVDQTSLANSIITPLSSTTTTTNLPTSTSIFQSPTASQDQLSQQQPQLQQRPSSLLMQINKQRQQRRQSSASSGSQDNVASSSNSLSISPPGSANRRRRSSTTSQSSSVLSETSRQQLQFDYSPDLPMDSSLDRANALDNDHNDNLVLMSASSMHRPLSISRPESPEPQGSSLSLAATGQSIESEAEIEMLENLRDGNASSGRGSLEQRPLSRIPRPICNAIKSSLSTTSTTDDHSSRPDKANDDLSMDQDGSNTGSASCQLASEPVVISSQNSGNCNPKLTSSKDVVKCSWRASPSPSPSSLGGSSTGSTHSSSARSSSGPSRKHSRDNLHKASEQARHLLVVQLEQKDQRKLNSTASQKNKNIDSNSQIASKLPVGSTQASKIAHVRDRINTRMARSEPYGGHQHGNDSKMCYCHQSS